MRLLKKYRTELVQHSAKEEHVSGATTSSFEPIIRFPTQPEATKESYSLSLFTAMNIIHDNFLIIFHVYFIYYLIISIFSIMFLNYFNDPTLQSFNQINQVNTRIIQNSILNHMQIWAIIINK